MEKFKVLLKIINILDRGFNIIEGILNISNERNATGEKPKDKPSNKK
jgi:hypothetical protein